MKTTIIIKNKRDLQIEIKKEIKLNDNNCDLNHFDVSNVEDMKYMFYSSKFNGNISKWDVSKVKNMSWMFSNSLFNGDISNWKTYKLKNKANMFSSCPAPKP